MAKKTDKKEEKWNFGIVRSLFGDYWVGRTKLPTNGYSIVESFESALETAKELAEGNEHNIMELEDAPENDGEEGENAEIIGENIEKFIVK